MDMLHFKRGVGQVVAQSPRLKKHLGPMRTRMVCQKVGGHHGRGTQLNGTVVTKLKVKVEFFRSYTRAASQVSGFQYHRRTYCKRSCNHTFPTDKLVLD